MNLLKSKFAAILVVLACAGCTTIKVPQAVGGSKADATVKLSYQYGGFEKPEVDWDQANLKARKKCNVWGYKDAEPFEASESVCSAWGQYGCISRTVTTTYQCIN